MISTRITTERFKEPERKIPTQPNITCKQLELKIGKREAHKSVGQKESIYLKAELLVV